MPQKKDIEKLMLAKQPVISKAMEGAIQNAFELGAGFVVIRRLNRGSELIIEEMLWHEVDDVLRSLGVKGAIFD